MKGLKDRVMNNKHSLMVGALLTITTQVVIAEDESLKTFKPELTPEFKELLLNADVKKGEAYFERKCSSCHTAEKGGKHDLGPALWNWFGRTAGTEAGFDYSEAMKGSGHIWGVETLNYYLSNTKRAVPGRIMNFRGVKKDIKRAELIRYLLGFNRIVPKF